MYYEKNKEKIRLRTRERYQLKKAFALMGFENKEGGPCKAQIDMPNAHFLLAELLSKTKVLNINP